MQPLNRQPGSSPGTRLPIGSRRLSFTGFFHYWFEVLVVGWLRFLVNRAKEQRRFFGEFWSKLDAWFAARSCTDECASEYASLAHEANWESVDRIDEGASAILAAKLAAAVELIRHEDTLNWTKFYNFIYINIALVAAYSWVIANESHHSMTPTQERIILCVICALGGLTSFGFLMTLWSGLSCLASHKEAVLAVDRAIAGIEHVIRRGGIALTACRPGSILLGKQGPTRIMLRVGPFLATMKWTALFVVSMTVNPQPGSDDIFFEQATRPVRAFSEFMGLPRNPEPADRAGPPGGPDDRVTTDTESTPPE